MSSSNEEDAQEAAHAFLANRRKLPPLGRSLNVEQHLVQVIRNLLAHAVYDEERTDACIAAVEDAKRAVKTYGAKNG